MKNFSILFMIFALFAAEWAWSAPGPINFNNTRFIRHLKKSFDYPIDLLQSTDAADHGNKYFTVRTLHRLGPEGLAEYDQKALRNEICASWFIYEEATNRNLATKWMPGSMGVYLQDESVVAVADDGLIGEPLDSVLRKLRDEPETVKAFAAKYYAVAMTKALETIHRAGIIWNNAHLRNFYVRPEGTLYPVDFSEAEKPAVADLPAREAAEWKNFVVNTVAHMYQLLFTRDKAQAIFLQLLNGTGVKLNWRIHPWNEAAFIAELVAALPAAVNNTPAVPMTGGLGGGYNNDATNFLERQNHIPYKPSLGIVNNIDKLNHTSAQDNNGQANFAGEFNFALDPAVRALVLQPNGAAYDGLIPAIVGETGMCNTWTGK